MKFKFCSDGDCPLWALSAYHAISSLPAPLFRKLLDCVVDGQHDDSIMEILKDTSLASREESARSAAVLRWTLQQAWSSQCSGSQLQRDLLVLGVPRGYAAALAEAADEGRADYAKSVEENGFMVNRVTDVTASLGPEESAKDLQLVKLTLTTDDVFKEEQSQNVVLLDKPQAKTLLSELKIALQKMEKLDQE